ncbi:MAG: methyltransferase domain-containing protein [Planctomycetes bacterium]|nr:methyltransferase domain-containing protein [Planctomycetota bacterium]
MTVFPSITKRVVEPEVMDDPALDPRQHERALAGLRRINWLSGSDRLVWGPVARLAKSRNLRRLRVIDIATGGGDVPLALWRRGQRRGLELEILGLDISPVAVEVAQQQADAAGAKVGFQSLDVFREPLPEDYDVVICSLFLHHLDRGQAIELLRIMAGAARRMVVVNDLERSRLGLLAAEAACRVFTRSPVVRVDGPRSVRAAFTMGEARELAREAELPNVRMVRRWPFRYVLTSEHGEPSV